jgi:hypothetical protein
MTSSIKLARVEADIGKAGQTKPGKWSSKVELETKMLSKALIGGA